MGAGQTETTDVLKPHIAPDEQLRASAVGVGEVTAVTDRRVLSLSQREAQTEAQREVESVLLTSGTVLGTRYGKSDSENRATLQRLLGIGLALLGVLVGVAGMDSGEGGVFVVALLLVGLGVFLYWIAEDEMEGGVTITLRRTDDNPDRTWRFPRGETDVPRAISREVARIHDSN